MSLRYGLGPSSANLPTSSCHVSHLSVVPASTHDGRPWYATLTTASAGRSQCLCASFSDVFLQGKLEELEAEIMEVNGNSERLARSYNELVELQLVLERAGSFFDQVRTQHSISNCGYADGSNMCEIDHGVHQVTQHAACCRLGPANSVMSLCPVDGGWLLSTAVVCLLACAAQARIDAQAESFDRTYSVPEAMDAPLLESALPVSSTVLLIPLLL